MVKLLGRRIPRIWRIERRTGLGPSGPRLVKLLGDEDSATVEEKTKDGTGTLRATVGQATGGGGFRESGG